MKVFLATGLFVMANVALASVIVGSPQIPSMDPFCAS